MSDFLSFRLPDDFVKGYSKKKPDWGFDIGGGNTLGELTFLTKYSRRKEDGSKERWHETCRRVVEGYYSILKDHCKANLTPWNENKAQKAAKDAYDRMFQFKWTPPGRGLWMMGTEFVNGRRNSAALQNCAFISTEKLSNHSAAEATLPFIRLMEMSMLGVGVGFDTKGSDKLTVHSPQKSDNPHLIQISDDREGWYESVGALLETYFFSNRTEVVFDYSLVRPAGEPIKGFGGVAAGPDPLIRLHESLRALLNERAGSMLSSSDIVDIMNLIGKCVVAGNVRRSAEIALGSADDEAFLDLKDFTKNAERMGENGWGHISNNSVFAEVGMDYSNIEDRVANNGEPGLLYLDLCRSHGRLVDPPNYADHRASGTNPCGEQTLESYECCTLVETFPFRHDSLEDYKKTLKQAYLYAKAVTLLPTHWPETNEVMQRNRRIGCSMSGVVQFVEKFGWTELRNWTNAGYDAVVARDRQYSEWLGVRESVKKTSIKPSGTVSILAGATPGAHWMPGDRFHIRRQRFSKFDPMVPFFVEAGYHVEPEFADPDSGVVVEFPTKAPDVRKQADVSVWEKAALAILLQRYWADNQVSVTLTFTESEKDQIGSLLSAHEGQLKSVSFLPIIESGGAYRQMPYEDITEKKHDSMVADIKPVQWKALYGGIANDAEGERFCANDVCLL